MPETERVVTSTEPRNWPPNTEAEVDPDFPGEIAVTVGGTYAMGLPFQQARELRDALNKIDFDALGVSR